MHYCISRKFFSPRLPRIEPLYLRAGCRLGYTVDRPVPLMLMIVPRLDSSQRCLRQRLWFPPEVDVTQHADAHGNLVLKRMLLRGYNEFVHDAWYVVPSEPEMRNLPEEATPVGELPVDVLDYSLPSRYCESDKLYDFAAKQFGAIRQAGQQVQAICEWAHNTIAYRYGSGSPSISALEVMQRGYGVCRDFAHVVIALCRALEIPARYVAGHIPRLAGSCMEPDSDIGLDFHAYAEVYLEGQWHTVDARHNRPLSGRIKIAHGKDAVDAAFATFYGSLETVKFQVWSYEVNPIEALGGPEKQELPVIEAAS
jgi:transglutaminase-like putative cysteine protease